MNAIIGDENNTLVGTDQKDGIIGLGGYDKLFGGAEDDVIDGGSGNNELYGSVGNDVYRVFGKTEGVTTIHDTLGDNFVWFIDHAGLDIDLDQTWIRSGDKLIYTSSSGRKVVIDSDDEGNYAVDYVMWSDWFDTGTLATDNSKTWSFEEKPEKIITDLENIPDYNSEFHPLVIGTENDDTILIPETHSPIDLTPDKDYDNSDWYLKHTAVYSGGGNDTVTVLSRDGKDVFAGHGNDVVTNPYGDIWGGAGNDTIEGGDGNNKIRGNDGNDIIRDGW